MRILWGSMQLLHDHFAGIILCMCGLYRDYMGMKHSIAELLRQVKRKRTQLASGRL